MTRPLVLIAAVGRNGAIGRDGGIPWRLAGDLTHFRDATLGKPVIMGRKTWQSIGRPLPGRRLVVVSTNPTLALPQDAVLCGDLALALDRAQVMAASMGADEVMVAGGTSLYAALIGQAERLDLTEVDAAPQADTFFPAIDPALWQEVSRRPQPREAGGGPDYAFVAFTRRSVSAR